jgi:hypothetical protein
MIGGAANAQHVKQNNLQRSNRLVPVEPAIIALARIGSNKDNGPRFRANQQDIVGVVHVAGSNESWEFTMPVAVETKVRVRFEELASQWKTQSRYLSNTAQMAMLWPYQQIIGLGAVAVPLILAELRRETDHWFWALEAITGENPVPSEVAGDVEAAATAWLRWGREKGLNV